MMSVSPACRAIASMMCRNARRTVHFRIFEDNPAAVWYNNDRVEVDPYARVAGHIYFFFQRLAGMFAAMPAEHGGPSGIAPQHRPKRIVNVGEYPWPLAPCCPVAASNTRNDHRVTTGDPSALVTARSSRSLVLCGVEVRMAQTIGGGIVGSSG
jgi:hypothetical protein